MYLNIKNKRKNINKKGKSKRNSKGKRTHKEAFGSISKEKDNYKPIKKYKNISNNKEQRTYCINKPKQK